MNLITAQYAEFLQGYDWDYFITQTFRRPRKEPYYALHSVWHTLKYHGAARAFLACEPHKTGDLHIHGIMAGGGDGWLPHIDPMWDIWEDCHKKYGRNKVELINTSAAVAGYCAKYVLKAQNVVADHYEVFGDKIFWKRA